MRLKKTREDYARDGSGEIPKLEAFWGQQTARHLAFSLAENPLLMAELMVEVDALQEGGEFSPEEQALVDEWESMTPLQRVWGKDLEGMGGDVVRGS